MAHHEPNATPAVPEFKSAGLLGKIALSLAGALTVLYVVSATLYLSFEYFSETVALVYLLVNFATWPVAIGLYVALCLWQVAVASNLPRLGFERPQTWLIWAGWFIPFASLALPAGVMVKLNARKLASGWWIALWWASVLAITVTNQVVLRLPEQSLEFYEMTEILLAITALSAMGSLYVLITRISAGNDAPSVAPEPPGSADGLNDRLKRTSV